MTRGVGAAPRWWRTLSWLTAAIALACGVVMILGALRWIDYLWPLMAQLGLLAVGGAWLILTGIGFFVYREWIPSALIAAIVAVAIAVPAISPDRLLFSWSRESMSDVADACITSGPRWAGAIRLQSVERASGICLLYTYGGFLNGVGYAQLPDGPPTYAHHRLNATFTHYTEDWYTFVQPF